MTADGDVSHRLGRQEHVHDNKDDVDDNEPRQSWWWVGTPLTYPCSSPHSMWMDVNIIRRWPRLSTTALDDGLFL